MAFKAVILLTRRADLSAQDFAAWWLGEHAALARQLPGLRGLRFNLVTAGGLGGEGAIDGISELWFDSQDAFEAAYATELGRAVAADSMAHLSRRERLFVDEHVLMDVGGWSPFGNLPL